MVASLTFSDLFAGAVPLMVLSGPFTTKTEKILVRAVWGAFSLCTVLTALAALSRVAGYTVFPGCCSWCLQSKGVMGGESWYP